MIDPSTLQAHEAGKLLTRIVSQAVAYRREVGAVYTTPVVVSLSPVSAQVVRKAYSSSELGDLLSESGLVIPELHPGPGVGLFALTADGFPSLTIEA